MNRTKECKFCGELYDADKGNKFFCSMNCRVEYSKKDRIHICKQCGGKFENYKKSKFCSQKCMGDSYKITKTGECLYCGEKFKITKNRKKYCSLECYHKSKKHNRLCECCGNKIKNYNKKYCSEKCSQNSKIKYDLMKCRFCGKEFKQVWKNQTFCSRQCMGKWRTIPGNNPAYIDGRSKENDPYCSLYNNKFKEYIRNKWFRKCLLCGKHESGNRRKFPTHHVDYNKMQGCDGNKWKVIPLCDSCHAKTTFRKERDYYEWLFSTLIMIREKLEEYDYKIDYRSLGI